MKKSALTQTAEDYASQSSIHGIGYVFDRDLNIVDRFLWLFLVLAFSGVAAALTWNFWTQWRNEQVGIGQKRSHDRYTNDVLKKGTNMIYKKKLI